MIGWSSREEIRERGRKRDMGDVTWLKRKDFSNFVINLI